MQPIQEMSRELSSQNPYTETFDSFIPLCPSQKCKTENSSVICCQCIVCSSFVLYCVSLPILLIIK